MMMVSIARGQWVNAAQVTHVTVDGSRVRVGVGSGFERSVELPDHAAALAHADRVVDAVQAVFGYATPPTTPDP